MSKDPKLPQQSQQPTEFALRFRPRDLSEVVGQARAVAQVQGKLASGELPHTILFLGPRGSGKTSMARILAEALAKDVTEENAALYRDIDSIRELERSLHFRPMTGGNKAYILDEVVQLPKLTQQGMLKMLEEPPGHVYLFLCSTTADGLLPTFLDRCYTVLLDALAEQDLLTVVTQASQRAEPDPRKRPKARVLGEIARRAGGSARRAVSLLETAFTQPTEEAQLLALGSATSSEKTEFLARLLLYGKPWPEVQKSLNVIEETDVETIRRQVLDYMMKVLANPTTRGYATACNIIKAFEWSWKDSGKAGLYAACFRLCFPPTSYPPRQ